MLKPPTTEIRLQSKLSDTILDKETEYDGGLPDYCPDITRLIRVDCTPYVDGCEVGSDRVHINGRVLYEILYETDRKNKLRFCSFTQEFSHSAELPKNELESLRADCAASCCRITCKMLSPRRLLLHARLELHTTVCGEKRIRMLSTELTEGVFFRKKSFRYDLPAETVENELRFDETLPLLQGEKNIGEVIFGGVTLQPAQTTVSQGCAVSKTNAVVKVLYEAEGSDSGYCMSTKNIPLTVTLESDLFAEEKHCAVSLSVNGCTVLPELDQYGENRLLKASFTVSARATLIGSEAVTVADDLFSSAFLDTVTETELTVPHLAGTVDRSFTVDLKFPADEPLFSSIYDTSVRVGRIRTDKADGGITLSGTLTVSVLGNGNDGIQHRDYMQEYEQFVPADLPEGARDTVAEVFPFEVLPTLHSDGSISARVICNVRVVLYTEEQTSFLSDITKREELDVAEDDYTLAYFFPSRADDLWSVAKRYRVDPERVREANPGSFDEAGHLVGGVKAVTIVK